MSRYTEYIDISSPETTEGELAELTERVISRGRRARRGRRAAISSLTAAAAAAVLTVSASAAYNWDLAAAVRAFFGDKENISGEIIVPAETENLRSSFDGLDISVKGAVRDKSFTVIFLDIDRTDGGVFDCAPYAVKDRDGNDMVMSDGNRLVETPVYEFLSAFPTVSYSYEDGSPAGEAQGAPIRTYTVDDGVPDDGHITQAICIDTSHPFFGYVSEPLVSSRVRLELRGLRGKKCTGSYVGKSIMLGSYDILNMSGEFFCDIDLGGCGAEYRSVTDAGMAEVPVYSNSDTPEGIVFTSHTFEVKEIGVSSVSLNMKLEGGVPEDTMYLDGSSAGALIMNDGREIKTGDYRLPGIVSESGNIRHIADITGQDKWTVSASFILPETVDIQQIRAVRIGDTEIPLE